MSQVKEIGAICSHIRVSYVIRKRTVNATHNRLRPVFYTSLLTPCSRASDNAYIIYILHFVTWEDTKSLVFVFSGDTFTCIVMNHYVAII
jgi:hypothetical protein